MKAFFEMVPLRFAPLLMILGLFVLVMCGRPRGVVRGQKKTSAEHVTEGSSGQHEDPQGEKEGKTPSRGEGPLGGNAHEDPRPPQPRVITLQAAFCVSDGSFESIVPFQNPIPGRLLIPSLVSEVQGNRVLLFPALDYFRSDPELERNLPEKVSSACELEQTGLLALQKID